MTTTKHEGKIANSWKNQLLIQKGMHRIVPSSLQWQQRWIATLGHFTQLKTKKLYKMEDLVTINTQKLISRVKAAHVGRLCLPRYTNKQKI